MSSIAILGSGFGLYGYLPALISGCGQTVLLPERYRERFGGRAELAAYSEQVEWVRDEYAAVQSASGAVLALSPSLQGRWIETCLHQANLDYLFLEKPLTSSPGAAVQIQDRLERSGKIIRIAYLFRYLEWASLLKEHLHLASDSILKIGWRFRAHHFLDGAASWKRDHEQGGGPVRFYGIHLVALLAEYGYVEVKKSSTSIGISGDLERWQATFSGRGLRDCEVEVDTNSGDTEFSIVCRSSQTDVTLLCQANPFTSAAETRQPGTVDERVEALSAYCRSAWDDDCRFPSFYRRTHRLWEQLEQPLPAIV